MGIVVDEELAKKTACHGFKNSETGELILWSPGIIGILSDAQEKKYCPTINISKHDVPEGIKKRWSEFRKIAKYCSMKVNKNYPKGKRLIPYLECISEMSKKENIEI